MNIAILFGGKSAEHEVSCISAYSVYENIDKERFDPILVGITKEGKFKYYCQDPKKLLDASWEDFSDDAFVDITASGGEFKILTENPIKIDCVFPVLHGPFGEDGKIQGLLEYANIPYVGCGVLSSAICMDKAFTKDIARLNEIPQTKYAVVRKEDSLTDIQKKIQNLSYPLFVKPANLGSSVGINKVYSEEELEKALIDAYRYDNKIIIEEGIDGREIEVAVLQIGKDIVVSTPGELIIQDEFYDYDTKYKKDTTRWEIPPNLPEKSLENIRDLALRAFSLLDCRGIARVDFFVEKSTGRVLFNEINTMPGFTKISMYPKLFMHDGIEYKELISNLIDSAMENYE